MSENQMEQDDNLLNSPSEEMEEVVLIDSQVPTASCSSEDEEGAAAAGEVSGEAPHVPQSPQRAFSPPRAMGYIPGGSYGMASSIQASAMEQSNPLHFALNIKVSNLLHFLLQKYRMRYLTTKLEMMNMVIQEYEDYYHVIFTDTCQSMKLVFGLEVIEIDPIVHTYTIVPALGLTYDGLYRGVPGVPKTGLLIMVLGVIFLEGNSVPEGVLWNVLYRVGICPGIHHVIFGEPSQLITQDFVQEGYLEYRQMPGTYPVCYEFLWGPRACAETTKMKVLEFLAQITGYNPRAFPRRYAEALREEQERA